MLLRLNLVDGMSIDKSALRIASVVKGGRGH
jgi:hypothetical protein